MFVCLNVSLCLSVSSSLLLSLLLHRCFSVMYLLLYLSFCLVVFLSLSLSLPQTVCISFTLHFAFQPFYRSVALSFYLPVFVSLTLFLVSLSPAPRQRPISRWSALEDDLVRTTSCVHVLLTSCRVHSTREGKATNGRWSLFCRQRLTVRALTSAERQWRRVGETDGRIERSRETNRQAEEGMAEKKD